MKNFFKSDMGIAVSVAAVILAVVFIGNKIAEKKMPTDKKA